MLTFLELVLQLETEAENFAKIYKCLYRRDIPKTPTKNKHLLNIINSYNAFNQLISTHYQSCNAEQAVTLTVKHNNLREKLIKVFTKLQIKTSIPTKFSEKLVHQIPDIPLVDPIVIQEDNSSYDLNFDLDYEKFIGIMGEEAAKAKALWINTYTKVVPEFDGSPANKTKFLDGLELIDENVGIYMATAVRIIKSKLSEPARSLITNEATVRAIIETITARVKNESSKAASAKLLNLKQGSKSATDYVKELENMTASLKRAFIAEGVPLDAADAYSTDAIAKSIIANSSNEKIKTVIQSADFKEVSDVAAKFVNISNDLAANKAQVFYNKYSNQRKGRSRNNFRGNNRNSYNNGRNNNGGNYNNGNYNNNINGQRGQNNNHSRGSRRGDGRNVRFAENSQAPQMTLGANPSTSTQ